MLAHAVAKLLKLLPQHPFGGLDGCGLLDRSPDQNPHLHIQLHTGTDRSELKNQAGHRGPLSSSFGHRQVAPGDNGLLVELAPGTPCG